MSFLKRKTLIVLLVGALLGLLVAGPAQAQEDTSVVRAILFYSPTCPHCEEVIEEDLPPLYDTYGSQLEIIGVNTREPEGWALYQAAAERFSIPENRRGVPTLIVEDTVLVGGDEIRQQFPGIIDQGLAMGGVGLPDVPELRELLSPESEAGSVAPEPASLSPMELFTRDPAGNSLAVIVLVGMVASLGYVALDSRRVLRVKPRANPGRAPRNSATRDWLLPALALVGLGVAGYLAYVETSQVEAICGPVGDCNTVQQSPYARLFGVLHIGIVGVIGYLGILAAWAWRRLSDDRRQAAIASLGLLGMTVIGVLFSIYLTFLEPFVIGATCAWCLASAVIMTALLLVTARPGVRALQVLSARSQGRGLSQPRRIP